MTRLTPRLPLTPRMRRRLACSSALLALACALLLASAERSNAAVVVGIGDQDATVFGDPLFTELGLKRARVFPPWNAALSRRHGAALDRWLAAALLNGIEPLVSFGQSVGSKCPRRPCKLPSVSEYTRAFKTFHLRWPSVRVISPWNEANHRSQPTFKKPKRAAQYYNIVRKYCRGCKIVAADVIDEGNMVRWLTEFKRTARKPRIWGLHNYRDTNKRRGQRLGGTKLLLKTVKGEVWLTETGGIVEFVLPNGRTLFRESESRANSATKRMFSLALKFRSRIKRLYIYQWLEAVGSRFDAGLVDSTGAPRPAYRTVQRYLRTPTFSP